MVASAEFEEKDYEAPLYRQLLGASSLIATPGQVFEGKFGIDAALQATNPEFWNVMGYKQPLNGAVLDDHRWGVVWRRGVKKRRLPTFSTNLLVQAKRPDVLKGRNASLSIFDITGGYWRFFVRPHQQEILEKIKKHLRNKLAVVYASPAFSSFDELYSHTINDSIIAHSSFVKVEKLKGHVAWNYDKPGTTGVANTEYEPIEDTPFIDQLELLSVGNQDGEPAAELNGLFKVGLKICKEVSESNGLALYYVRAINAVREQIMQSNVKVEITLPFVGFSILADLLGVSWLCIAGRYEQEN